MPDSFDNFIANVLPKLPSNRPVGEVVHIQTFPSVATSATRTLVPAAGPMASRREITVQNTGAVDVWFGTDTVTVGTGFKVAAGTDHTFNYGPGVRLYAISSAASTINGFEGR